MLVATASAAPVRPRRRWSIGAPIVAFALAGALTGAVSAAAFNAPPERAPVSVDALVDSFIPDDTQLFGAPVVVDGHRDTAVPLGAMPEGAVELAVVFRCEDPGNFDLLVDGKAVMTMICDEGSTASGGGGGYFSVNDASAHTLAISDGEGRRYVVWASWVARAVPLPLSPEQAAALADGAVTQADYHTQFDRYAECMAVAGHPLEGVDTSGTIIRYVASGAAVSSGAADRCYAQEFAQVDRAWQSEHQDTSDDDRALRACLEVEGITPVEGGDPASLWRQVQAAGIDPVRCLFDDNARRYPLGSN
ncbi:hypothetical protein CLV54_0929 [Compostimonas suwonensis]|uniref:Uncharacterized protein n=2 Tax=Compostimonas suwonensis TaxID=1048394 RepID=A0A2M9BYV6_9MICO|nr:hypothetical protein CLV54_0929 [Compostimonas suwonensis]